LPVLRDNSLEIVDLFLPIDLAIKVWYKAVGGALYKYLRHQHKKYRKRYGKNDYRGRIPNRIDINERPSIVDARTRIGDWEVDLVIAFSLTLSKAIRLGKNCLNSPL
jgi:IS30 family transposase